MATSVPGAAICASVPATTSGRQLYVHVIRGSVKVNGIELSGGDAAHLDKEASVRLSEDSEVLVFDLPY